MSDYPSAWQAHKANACDLRCRYCVERNKNRGLSWRFIPADKYQLFREQEAERKKKESQPKLEGGRIKVPQLIQDPFIRRGA